MLRDGAPSAASKCHKVVATDLAGRRGPTGPQWPRPPCKKRYTKAFSKICLSLRC